MFTQRQRKILEILKNCSDSITSEEIARLTGVSSKTVRTDIKSILPALQNKIAKINISTRKGYSIEILDETAFEKIFIVTRKNLLDNEDRIKYIIRRLLECSLNNKTIKQQDLADELYIGLSTLKSSLKEVKEKLKKYNLDIINYKNQGMWVKGNEAQVRYCISEYIFDESTNLNNFYQNLFADYDLSKIKSIIIKVLTSYEMLLTDNSLDNLMVHVIVAIKRAQAQHNVTYTLRESRDIEQHREFLIATSIFEEIYTQMNIDVATNEIYYLTQHLIASKKYSDSNSHTTLYIDELVTEMLQRVHTIVGINFLHDDNLKKWLKVHLESVIPRMRFHMNIRNEILDVIKNEYPLAFQIGVIASKVIEEKEHIVVNENEIGYIAVHFGAALTRMDVQSGTMAKSAIIVCGSGIGTAILLKARLKEYFKDLIKVTKTVPGYKLKSESIKNTDLIFSTIPLKLEPELSSKLIYVKNLLNTEEIEVIQHKFFSNSAISQTNIKRFFQRDCFIINKQFENKEDILTYMTTQLEHKGLIDKETSKSIFERENTSPTEIGNLVALPHPMINNTAISSISVLILNKPIMWVEHHVQVIFLISIAKNEFYLWEPIFLKLFKYLVKENGIKKMISDQNYDSFIKDFEKQFN